MERKPVILISGSATDSKSVAAIMADVRTMGAEPVLIANHGQRLTGKDATAMREQAKADMARAHGVIIMGNNNDIDPRDYKATSIHKETKAETATPEGKARADYEYALAEEALDQKVPLLGICGGMQRMNVLTGGTLHQHVPDLVGDNRHSQASAFDAPFIPVEYVAIEPGSGLSIIAGDTKGLFTPVHHELPPGVFMDNSFHHQSIDKVGAGFRASAHSVEPDKKDVSIIEAIEPAAGGPYTNQFAMGVQWHPEFGASEVSANVLKTFNGAVQAYARSHEKTVVPGLGLEEALTSLPIDQLNKAAELYVPAPVGAFTAKIKADRTQQSAAPIR